MNNSTNEKKLDLDEIVLIGRTFDEYYSMFRLNDLDLHEEKILDVASGVSSFCCEASLKGYNITASDRIYCLDPDEITKKCSRDLDIVMGKLPDIMDLYKWEYFKSIDELKAQREKAYRLFVSNYKKEKGLRYIDTSYPQTGFCDNEFTVSLVSHFLFMYDEHLDYNFHKNTILELIRITSKEIRLFPLVNLKGQKSPFIDILIKDLAEIGYKTDILKVEYEFVRNGNEMMVIHKN